MPRETDASGVGRPADALDRLLAAGVSDFDAGRFFEAHEAWEEAWHAAPDSERDFFQGLVHVTAACLHHHRANGHGFERQMARMRRRLAPFGPNHRGVAVSELVSAMEGLPPPGRHATYPRIGAPATVM